MRAAVSEARVVTVEAVGAGAGSVSRDLAVVAAAVAWVGGRLGGWVAACASGAVPGRFGLSHALAHGDHAVAGLADALEHVRGEIVGGQVVDVVGDGEEVVVAGGFAIEGSVDVVLGVLDLVDGELVVVCVVVSL